MFDSADNGSARGDARFNSIFVGQSEREFRPRVQFGPGQQVSVYCVRASRRAKAALGLCTQTHRPRLIGLMIGIILCTHRQLAKACRL